MNNIGRNNRYIGIALAGGLSSRTAGGDKLLLELGGRTVIEHCVAGMEAQCEKIFVVTGHKPERFEFLKAGHPRVELVHNARYRSGMFSSVAAGLDKALMYAAKIRGPASGWYLFITPGDHALIARAVYRALAQAVESNRGTEAFLPVFLGREGHPLMISADLARKIMMSSGASAAAANGLRGCLEACGSVPVRIDCLERGVLMDLDTPADYEEIKTEYDKYNNGSG